MHAEPVLARTEADALRARRRRTFDGLDLDPPHRGRGDRTERERLLDADVEEIVRRHLPPAPLREQRIAQRVAQRREIVDRRLGDHRHELVRAATGRDVAAVEHERVHVHVEHERTRSPMHEADRAALQRTLAAGTRTHEREHLREELARQLAHEPLIRGGGVAQRARQREHPVAHRHPWDHAHERCGSTLAVLALAFAPTRAAELYARREPARAAPQMRLAGARQPRALPPLAHARPIEPLGATRLVEPRVVEAE